MVLAGRYEAGEVLGSGGVGQVLAGRDRRLGRDVAIKVLRPDMAYQPGVRERFENEARLAARLAHPNIVAVFDFGVEGGVPFLVMQRLSGETLADVVGRRGPLGFDEAGDLGLQVLDALAAAHRAGMIHRDVKPRNILVGGPGCWKVGDFGIAKSIEAGEGSLTAAGLVVGTPAYLAPERLAGAPATVATDIYGAGVVLYQAVAGRAPFEAGLSPVAMAAATPQPIHVVRPDIPVPLAAVITQAMARDPSVRFATAAHMARALRSAVRGDHVADDAPLTVVEGAPATAAGTPGARATAGTPGAPATAAGTPGARATAGTPGARATAGTPGAPGATQVMAAMAPKRRWAPVAAAVAAVLVVSVAVLLAGGHRNTSAGAAGGAPTTSTTGPPASTPPIPPALEGALNRLATAVRP